MTSLINSKEAWKLTIANRKKFISQKISSAANNGKVDMFFSNSNFFIPEIIDWLKDNGFELNNNYFISWENAPTDEITLASQALTLSCVKQDEILTNHILSAINHCESSITIRVDFKVLPQIINSLQQKGYDVNYSSAAEILEVSWEYLE